jgi:hypothetical protein
MHASARSPAYAPVEVEGAGMEDAMTRTIGTVGVESFVGICLQREPSWFESSKQTSKQETFQHAFV